MTHRTRASHATGHPHTTQLSTAHLYTAHLYTASHCSATHAETLHSEAKLARTRWTLGARALAAVPRHLFAALLAVACAWPTVAGATDGGTNTEPAVDMRLSLHFESLDVRLVMRTLADALGVDLVLGPEVAGLVTLKLTQVPWHSALRSIEDLLGLQSRWEGRVLWVRTRAEVAAIEQQALERRRRAQEFEVPQTRVFQLRYSRAEELAKGLGHGAGGLGVGTPGASAATASSPHRILSARATVLPLTRTNQLVVTDSQARLDALAALMAQVDVPVRQVQIEARIVEAADTFARSLGTRMGAGLTGASSATPPTLQPAWALPAVGLHGADPASLAFRAVYGAAAQHLLQLELSALESDGRGRVVSSPRIVTADQVEASVKQGFRVPYRGSAQPQQGLPPVQFQEANLRLVVTPQLIPGGKVLLSVLVNKDSLGALTPEGREINTKEIRTQVLVEDGGTAVIGGIYENEASDAQTGIPWLSQMPVVGALFQRTARDQRRTELLIFLTPHILEEAPRVPP